MRITEGALRRIIREELIREAGVLDVFSEPTMKDTSVDTMGKLKYVAARTLGGAETMGATQIAKGQVNITPTVSQALSVGWNSKPIDWAFTALGAALDGIPGIGLALSIGVAQVQIVKAAAAADWMGVIFGTLAMFPVVGDALGIVGRAYRDGLARNAGPAVKALAKAIGDIETGEIIAKITEVAPQVATAQNQPQIKATFEKFKKDLAAATA